MLPIGPKGGVTDDVFHFNAPFYAPQVVLMVPQGVRSLFFAHPQNTAGQSRG